MTGRIIIFSLLFSLNVAGQEQETIDSISTPVRKATLMGRLHQVQQFLDSNAMKKVDPHYIEVPKKPWRVQLRYKENVVDVDYTNTLHYPGTNSYSDWQLCFEPPVAASIGVWVGYRGTGISLSKSLAKNAGRYFSISSTGARYGFNFRLRRFNTQEATLKDTDYEEGKAPVDTAASGNMPAPVWIRSVYVNGYYVFNGRRYSQAAAYNQSVIQRRSAGSFLAGLTWYQSSFDFSDIDNVDFMIISHNVNRIKVHQANIGLGYGYNFVPFRGFVINAMAMPTLSVYNRVKIYKYDFNYAIPSPDMPKDGYGNWNHETKRWENGEKYKPIPLTEGEDPRIYEQFDYWEDEPETTYSALRLNLDLRLGIAYNWSNYFVGIQAQYNNFTYKKDQTKVNIYDAYARLSLGVRL